MRRHFSEFKMIRYNSSRRLQTAPNAVSKHTNLGFKPNPSSMYRMPYNPPMATQLSGKWMMTMPDKPSKHCFENSTICRDGYVTTSYEDGYASAMEPMDNDEWGEEGYWMSDSTHDQMNSIPAKRKSPYVHAPRDSPSGKNLKSVPLPYAKHMPPCGPNLMSKPLRQSLLKIDSSKGLTVKLEPKPQKALAIRKLENGRAVFPKWGSSSPTSGSKMDLDGKDGSFPRVFTVTVERLLQWPKILTGSRAIFELYGILDSVSAGKYPHSKIIVLRSEKFKDYLTCTFFEIDRALPALEKNKWQRCILLVRSNKEYQCLKIRSATPNELKNLDPMVTKSSKSKALLLKSLHA